MHASNSKTVLQGKMVVRGKMIFWCLLPAMAMTLAMPFTAAWAQEVGGDFDGETQYTDKDGNARDIKEPTAKDRAKVNSTLFVAGKTSSKDEEQTFEDLAHYYVNALTLKKNIAVLGDKRKELKTRWLAPAGQKNRTVADLHTRFNELTLTTCLKVAEDPKYPRAIRFNCILMLGELDAEEYEAGRPNSNVPWPSATTALLEIARDEQRYVALRLAAVVALKRHTTLSVAASLQPQLADTLLGILAIPVADEANPGGQIWLRLEAADVLHEAIKNKVPVDQAKLAAALVDRLNDERMPNWARAKLAGELGKLPGRSLTPEQLPLAARSLASLMLSVCQTSPFTVDPEAEAQKEKEAEAAKKEDEKKSADKKGSDKKGDKKTADKKVDGKEDNAKKDGSKDDKAETANAVAAEPPSPAVQKINSEEMMWQLSQIRLALYGKDAPTSKEKGPDAALGLRAAATGDVAQMIDKTVEHIDAIVKLLTEVPDGKDIFSKLADNLRTTGDDLETLLNAPAAEGEEAAPAAKPVAGRSRPPAGNAPADASATGK